jgi:hypothetical protein
LGLPSGSYFAPEVELNDTAWLGGARGGLNQLYMTLDAIFGRFQLTHNTRFIIGGSYQLCAIAASGDRAADPGLWPQFRVERAPRILTEPKDNKYR